MRAASGLPARLQFSITFLHSSGREIQRVSARTRLGQIRDRVAERRGRNIGVIAARPRAGHDGVLRAA